MFQARLLAFGWGFVFSSEGEMRLITRVAKWASSIVLSALLFVGGVNASSWSTDVTDIWWNPNESGWGLNLVQTDSFVFATLYVYDLDGKPTWFTGELQGVLGTLRFTGPLYVSSGPYFGFSVFNPALVTGRQAGTMTFTLSEPAAGTLTYTVDGVVVNKSVQRQPLTLDNYSGTYEAIETAIVTGCFNPVENGTITYRHTVQISQNGKSMQVVYGSASASCTVNGVYSQLGRVGAISGAYTCTGGDYGNYQMSEMTNNPYQFNARLDIRSTDRGCVWTGQQTGVVPY